MNNEALLNHIKRRVHHNGYSYLAHLAITGRDEAVIQWLEETPTARKEAIYGYATMGNSQRLNEYMSNAGTTERDTATMGLSRGKHITLLNQLTKYAPSEKPLILGYAQGKHELEVSSMINKKPYHFPLAVEGYASGGQSTELFNLISGTSHYKYAIYYAAKNGHKHIVDTLLQQIDSSDAHSKIQMAGFMDIAIIGYCHGFHLKPAIDLLNKDGTTIQNALDALETADPNATKLSYLCLMLLAHTEDINEKLREGIQSNRRANGYGQETLFSFDSIQKLRSQLLNVSDSALLWLENEATTTDKFKSLDQLVLGNSADTNSSISVVSSPRVR